MRVGLGVAVVSALLLPFLLGAGSCSTEATSTPPPEPTGWVQISQPSATGTFATGCSSVTLGGTAFVSPGWYHCCPADCAVEVAWSNATTGASGTALSTCSVSLSLWSHEWVAALDLAPGENLITVTATDPSGLTGNDQIRVTYDTGLPCS